MLTIALKIIQLLNADDRAEALLTRSILLPYADHRAKDMVSLI